MSFNMAKFLSNPAGLADAFRGRSEQARKFRAELKKEQEKKRLLADASLDQSPPSPSVNGITSPDALT